jgi:hypothetical protein
MRIAAIPLWILVVLLAGTAGCDEDEKASDEYSEVFRDEFDRADGEIGGSWIADAADGSTFAIVDERLRLGSEEGSRGAFFEDALDAGTSERVSMDAFIDGADMDNENGPILLIARAEEANIEDSGGAYLCGLVDSTLLIGLPSDEGVDPLAFIEDSISTNDGDAYELTFTLEGSNLACNLETQDGSAEYEVTTEDDTYDGGYAGLFGGDPLAVTYFDDFLLETK